MTKAEKILREGIEDALGRYQITHVHAALREAIKAADATKKGGTLKGFDAFWAVYPWKNKKAEARKVWKCPRLDSKAALLVADVQKRMEQDEQWRAGFIPLPTSYLRGERWDDAFTKPKAVERRTNGGLQPVQEIVESLIPSKAPPGMDQKRYDSMTEAMKVLAYQRFNEIREGK